MTGSIKKRRKSTAKDKVAMVRQDLIRGTHHSQKVSALERLVVSRFSLFNEIRFVLTTFKQ